MSLKYGKHYWKWKHTREKWIKQNQPSHEGYYFCVVGYRAMTVDEMTLDHDVSRSRDPAKRYDFDNLNPMCGYHNSLKGSKSLQEFLDSNPDLNCR